jgi:hypothetical protein
MDKITHILENVVRCKYFEMGVHIKNPIKNSYQEGLGRTTHTLDHVVVVHILIWDKRKSQNNEYSDGCKDRFLWSLILHFCCAMRFSQKVCKAPPPINYYHCNKFLQSKFCPANVTKVITHPNFQTSFPQRSIRKSKFCKALLYANCSNLVPETRIEQYTLCRSQSTPVNQIEVPGATDLASEVQILGSCILNKS